ncbi:Lipin/Ned1/Smp2-domain-containing protein [Boletus edulis BED1]|uniref:phosphatidate phosphatase n=1 Tax=Boletus edulis BED1 TaxID=1328754 RepID=A0AAD4BQN3_BOLED|nr:Lipin/Ned1/Smp2-domain-containing protein [Boletus edulis BED1]
MNYLRGAVSAISAPYQYYKDINPSTLTGAIDVIVIRKETDDGDVTLACSPFHVRFGKLQVLRPAEKKVNISVNGNPIPFSMKIGDAGEAFFVFETEEDIPEDLVTSPILSATNTTPQDEIPSKCHQPPRKIPEPEFLDLNAALSNRTPPIEVDFPQAPAVSPPSIQYTDNMALDMAGYHSPVPDKSTFVDSRSQTQVTSASTTTDQQILFPPSKPSIPSHLQTSFTARRAVSDSPDDVTSKHDTLAAEAGGSSVSIQEYSWEWGAFPQPSPLQTRFTPSVLKGKGNDARLAVDEDDLVLKRSRSVPPELDGSPHTILSPLPRVDGNDSEPSSQPPVHQEPSEYEDRKPFGSGGPITTQHDDQTKFQVCLDGTLVDFELSLVSLRDAFHDRDEAESERAFNEGIIDYARLLADENLVRDERLVMRWTGRKYITREQRSPLMDALHLWVSTARDDRLTALPSPPLSPSPEQQLFPSLGEHKNLKRADSEPPGVLTRKSTSSWVMWWSRSRDIPLSERPVLGDAATLSLDQNLTKPVHVHSPLPLPSASAPETIPVAIRSPTIQPVSDTVPVGKEKKFAKTLRLSSDQLKSLNLKPGANTMTFSLSTTGTPGCAARIFLWDSTDHVVISDIDGTITKSDGLGHLFTMIGRDWTHLGVAKLYTDITRNGYKIMYLTSRAIGQADSTRIYLKGIKQNDYQLPEGPVIMSPDRLMTSLHREVIMRKPEVFKMACLRDIQRLFGEGPRTPFYAGFGNRITDALSYRSVSVPSARVFTIDPSGEVKMELLELAGYKSSYTHMTDLVDQMFPPIHRKSAPDYTDFNYWRPAVQEFPLPDLAPPSPALSARLRNFSLVGSRQPVLVKPSVTGMANGTLDGGGHRSSHLRQMSSFERLSSRLVALTQSPSYNVEDGSTTSGSGSGTGSIPSQSSGSASSTYLDSEDEGDVGEDGELKKRRRTRSTSMSSMPGSLDDMHFETDEEEGEAEAGEEGGYMYDGENEEEAAEEAFDEDFLATGEMQNVPYL